ncbi:MAG: SAM-dependent methyltransferase, partial [Rhodobacteraceae bacterium]|nr:SAM-dependent methyltransferase [Paracoccaceae bacterium]
MEKEQLHYDTMHIGFLEKLWGDGFMSPGGYGEVKRLLIDTNMSGSKVLDIGCGAGGITLSLVKDFEAKMVIGVDVEADVVKKAKTKVKKASLD